MKLYASMKSDWPLYLFLFLTLFLLLCNKGIKEEQQQNPTLTTWTVTNPDEYSDYPTP